MPVSTACNYPRLRSVMTEGCVLCVLRFRSLSTHSAACLIPGPDTKELLKATTSEAVAAGAYGAPFLVISQAGKDTMVAFGSDRFEQLAFSLGWQWLGPDPTRPTAGPRPRL
jgi:2-hydroxychromene-2-carboxylate isomerase